jgi:hypothetical protein
MRLIRWRFWNVLTLLLSGLFMGVALGLLAWFSYRYARYWAKALVSDRFALANDIILTEAVPAGWRLKLVEAFVRRDPQAPIRRRIHALLYGWYIRRLDGVARQIAASSIIKKADKLELITALQMVRSEWQRAASRPGED